MLGQAMIEAHELESRVSIYPRITVSRKLYSLIPKSVSEFTSLKDRDGIIHFNYFKSMIWAGGGQKGDGFRERLNTWLREARRTVAENIDNFERDEKWNEMAKWVWFKHHLEQARASYPIALSNEMFD